MSKIYGSLLPKAYADRPLLGEKTPANIVEHRTLRQHFPAAKFLCIVRRPDTNLASIYQRYPSDHLEHALEHYAKFCDAAVSLKNEESSAVFIRYEDFIDDPQATVDRIAPFIGCKKWQFNGSITSYNMPEYVGTSVSRERSINIVDLAPKERALIEDRCQNFIRTFYPTDW